MRVRTGFPVLVGTLLGVLLAGCGGGGGGAAPEPPPSVIVTSVDPAVVYGEEYTDLAITGEGFAAGTTTVTIRLLASSGTPFMSGTSDSIELTGDVESDTEVTARVPRTRVDDTTSCRCSVELSNGDVGQSSGTVLTVEPQLVQSLTPSVYDGSKANPFEVTGRGFHTIGQDATVIFTARSGGPFHPGMAPSSVLSVKGRVVSETRIVGDLPYAGVEVSTVAGVTVILPNGTSIPGAYDLARIEKGSMGVRGTWTYDRPPCTDSGLDYASVEEKPIRGAIVVMVNNRTRAVVTARDLTDAGEFEIDYSGDDPVFLRVLAETRDPRPPIQIRDNVYGGSWATDAAPVDIDGQWQTRNYNVPLNWTGSSYSGGRPSAPFAILDSMYGAASRLYAERDLDLDLLWVFWSPLNKPEEGDVGDGQIGTTYYLDGEIYVLGQEDVDTDEFDDHVLVHEWGHYLEDSIGRADSLGGSHYGGALLEPTLAFSEGFCNALSGLLLYPDSTYRDTFGEDQASAFGFDLEDNSIDSVAPGWYGEDSVACIVYDLFDTDSEGAWDTGAVSLGSMCDVLTDVMKDTPALTTIYAFVSGLRNIGGLLSSQATAICNQHQVYATADAWGTGETNDAGWSANLPVFRPTSVGTEDLEIRLYGLADWNGMEANRKLYFQGTGSTVQVIAKTDAGTYLDDHDIMLWITHNGEVLTAVDDYWYGEETASFAAHTGETYVIHVMDLGYLPGDYPCWVSVKLP